MKRKGCLLLCFILLTLTGCGNPSEPMVYDPEDPTEVTEMNPVNDSIEAISSYELTDTEVADCFEYKYKDRSVYFAGLKVFEEFSTTNEGSVLIIAEENALIFAITKATGTVTGALDGPVVYFKMDLATLEIIEKRFEPAPNYAELGITEFIEYSEEVIELTNERMVEIGVYFKELIEEIEAKND